MRYKRIKISVAWGILRINLGQKAERAADAVGFCLDARGEEDE